MRIGKPLLRLPIRFSEDALRREVEALPQDAWRQHPQKFDGNIAVPLVSPGGTINDGASGGMAPTPWLARSPYILDIMRALDATWGRSRLMGLRPGAEVPEHVDIHYYWRTHLRIHIPVITNPLVRFTCAGETVHMKPGECWILDSFYRHSVHNGGTDTRIHLVLDTVGSARMWDLIESALAGDCDGEVIGPGQTPQGPLNFEQINSPLVMSPWEIRCHVAYIADWTDPQPGRDELLNIVDRFVMSWTGTWARYGVMTEGLPLYLQHLSDVHAALAAADGSKVMMRNGRPMGESIQRLILGNAIGPALIQNRPLHRSAAAVRVPG